MYYLSLQASGLISTFKLSSRLSTNNMMLFDKNGIIKRYETPEDILREFYEIRLDFYRCNCSPSGSRTSRSLRHT